jgi:ferric-dicitrate binding protein FerR (iron transport regulator)
MRPQPNLDELFSAWREEPLPAARTTPTKEGSIAITYALREVARRRRRQRILRRSSLVAAVAAGVFGLGISLWMYERPPASVATLGGSGSTAIAAQPEVTLSQTVGDVRVIDSAGGVVLDVPRLAEGYGVRTREGSASLGFPSGAAARVSRRSALKLTATEHTESLLLTRGRVDVEVPKLDAERGFSVETPDAKVIVHGTGFSVSVDPDGDRGIWTSVSVTHGVVSVQHAGQEVRLTAGQSWPADLQPAPKPDGDELRIDDDAGPSERASEKPRKRAGKASRGRRAPSARESRELAEQNGHFARAMTLKNQGQTQGALDELTHLLSSHPASPLRQEARVERLRILRSLGRTEAAASEASHYLSDFPDGYAAQEARELLEEQP